MQEIIKALVAFQAECPEIQKNSEVKYQSTKFRYADLDQINAVTRPVLTKHGLATTQTIQGTELVTTLWHVSGQSIESRIDLVPFGFTARKPQEIGSAITYARRYALTAMLGVTADSDDDGQAAANQAQQQKQAPQGKPKFTEKELAMFGRGLTEGKDLQKMKAWAAGYEISPEMVEKMKGFVELHNAQSNGAAQ